MAENAKDLARQGEKLYRAGKHSEAAEFFRQAAEQYAASGETTQAAEQSNNRSVALLQAGDPENALLAAQGTEAVFAQAGDQKRQALALGNQAAAFEALGRLDEALALYRKSSDLLKLVGDSESRAMVLKAISALQVRTGRQLEALASMDAALENQPRLSIRERFLKKLIDIPFRMLRR